MLSGKSYLSVSGKDESLRMSKRAYHGLLRSKNRNAIWMCLYSCRCCPGSWFSNPPSIQSLSLPPRLRHYTSNPLRTSLRHRTHPSPMARSTRRPLQHILLHRRSHSNRSRVRYLAVHQHARLASPASSSSHSTNMCFHRVLFCT